MLTLPHRMLVFLGTFTPGATGKWPLSSSSLVPLDVRSWFTNSEDAWDSKDDLEGLPETWDIFGVPGLKGLRY